MRRNGRKCSLAVLACLSVPSTFVFAVDKLPSLTALKGVHVLAEPLPMANGLTLVATVDAGFDISSIQTSFNTNAADTTNADVLQNAPYNLSGAGKVIGMWEINRPRATHVEFGGGISYGDGSLGTVDQHATHVAGTLAALGLDGNARGMASLAVVRSYDAANDSAEIGAAAGLIASNHSYGFIRGWDRSTNFNGVTVERTWFADRETTTEDPLFGKYDANAAALDAALHTNDRLLSVWAAANDRDDNVNTFPVGAAGQYLTYFSQGSDGPGGNPAGWYRLGTAHATFPAPGQDGNNGAGYDSLPQNQTAKNSLVVGAIDDITAEGVFRTGAMSTFSSWGMTDDGRMKPDVVGNGVNVYSASNANDNDYATLSGTSMASPNVAGTMALVNEHLMNKRATATVPYSATSKAVAIHTAFDLYNFGPDYQSGYGVVDGEEAAAFIDGAFAANPEDHIIEDGFVPGDFTWEMSFTATSIAGVKATLVWNDAAGAANTAGLDDATSALVNDLDLWITDAANNIYHAWTLDPNNPANAAVRTTWNTRDNVEQVLTDLLAFGIGEVFTVHVVVPPLLGAFQDFSLLVSGGTLVPEPTMLAFAAIGMLALRRRR